MNIEIYTGGILTETAARHGYMPRFLARPANDDSIHHEDAQAHEYTDFTPVPGDLSRYVGRGLYARLTNTPV